MTTAQHKIGSGFDATSTADDVLQGMDLSGKLAIVTGGYSGIGLETTRALTRLGARAIVPARRPAEALRALEGVSGVEVDEMDLSDLESVRGFAERYLASGRTVDFVIDSAGIMACPETRVGPGWEAQFAINHLGHFALVNRLWPALEPGGARVVSVSSGGHHMSGIRWDDIHWRRDYDKWQAYGQAKTANALFAVHLDRLAKGVGVRAFAVHPGVIITPLLRHVPEEERVEFGWFDGDGNLRDPDFFKAPQQGAATQVWAATSPQLTGLGGLYLEDCDVAEPAPADGEMRGVKDWATDPEQAARLWELSAELTSVNAFAA
ncbi:SDR family NAD(P)-dependent oxidoreductase [Streptomyces sp. NPDC007162]|uniref:SDR family NAD(P)-dependent oxidoreductase n=1 Tax=Streptomyces sp. NPDC007162 TaxID=3156917 RepID=UPI0033EF576D